MTGMYSLEDKGLEEGVRLANGTHSIFRYQKVVKVPDCKRRLVMSLVVVQWRRPHHLDSPMIRAYVLVASQVEVVQVLQ